MKKLILLLLVCFMVTGCGNKSIALNENKAYKQEDVIETTAETTTEETEAELEYAISAEDLIERISTTYPTVNSDMVKNAVEEDYDASLLYYYNALKTNQSDYDMASLLRRVVAGEGFVYSDDIVVSDIGDIAYDVSFVNTAESAYFVYKTKFIDEMANRIYNTYGYREGYTDELKQAVEFLCNNNLDDIIAYYYEYLDSQYNDYSVQSKLGLAIVNAMDEKIVNESPNLAYTSIVRNDVSVLDSLEANFKSYVDEVNESIVADRESRAAEEASLAAVAESEGLKVSWEPIRYDADGMDFQGAMASSAWYGVEFQKGTGNDGSTYYRGLFNNKNDDSRHLYAEWTYKNGGDTYQVEVSNSHIEDCSSYYKY